jgi:hypothetical protein
MSGGQNRTPNVAKPSENIRINTKNQCQTTEKRTANPPNEHIQSRSTPSSPAAEARV